MRAPLLALAVLALSASPALAAPGDYVITYDWQGGDGFTGWGENEVPAVGTPGYQSPFYAARLAPPELRVATSPAADGTADRVYPAIDAFGPRRILQVEAPGTTRIRSATFDNVDSLRGSGDLQTLRLAVYGDTPAAAGVYDFRFDTPPQPGAPGNYQNDILYSDIGPITVDPTDLGRSAQVWLATSCDPSCPTVTFGAGGAPRSYGQVGEVSLDLLDPEAPAVAASGALTGGGWTNARETQSAAINATDPGAGVRGVAVVRRRSGGGAVTVHNAPADCDRDHVRPGVPGRGSAPCPDRLDTGFAQALGQLPDGEYSYEVTATDDSARTATQTFALRLDRTRPATVSGTGPLRSAMGRWTNRTDRASLLVRARDSRSGIRRVELIAQVNGEERVIAGADAACASRCPDTFSDRLDADLNALPDGRIGIATRAIDAAGNVTDRQVGTLLLDRVAPTPPVVALREGAGATVLAITPGSDPAPGSGVVGYVATYRRATAPATRQTMQVPAGDSEVRGRGTRARISGRVTGETLVRSLDRAGNASRAFATGPGMVSCREALEGTPFVRPAKIGEIRTGVDTTGTFTYGQNGEQTLELVGSLSIKGVGVSFSEGYTRSAGAEIGKKVGANKGYNMFVRLIVQPERLRRYVNGKREGYCKRTAGPKRVFKVVGTAANPLEDPPMPASQRRRADCNNAQRWGGRRVRLKPDYYFRKDDGHKISFSRGLTVLNIGYTTANTYARSSAVRYDWKHRYKAYWICGDGGKRNALREPDPVSWINLFAGADLDSGRNP